MSETVFYVGKLKPVAMQSGEATCEDVALRLLKQNGKGEQRDSWNETWVDQLRDDFYDLYVVADGNIYEVADREDVEEGDLFNAERNADGTISFQVRYYNGGCGFGEAIDEALKKLV